MRAPAPVPVADDTRRKQLLASDPAASAWVSANAGSGKTYVLVQRVLRLLHDGVDPARILCLTFTKAAAANMAARVFDRLRAWATADDATLARLLEETTGASPDARARERARTLFARAIETPGGLKIQTIHAFCERVLHQFPFEANAPAQFKVADAMQEGEMLRLAMRDALDQAAQGDAPLARAVERLAVDLGRDKLRKLLREATAKRDEIAALFDEFTTVEAAAGALARELGLAPGETPETLDARLLAQAPPRGEWPAYADRLAAGSKTDADNARALREAAAAAGDAEAARLYPFVFLTGKLQPRKATLTAGLRKSDPALADWMDAEAARLLALLERRRAAALVARTADLMRLAGRVLAGYADRKAKAGLLDFHDLIDRTRRLLDGAPSAWIMWKLDQGVDHVLIDEAQDTSPAQWDILKALTRDFFAGAGRAARPRTVFAVGDEKQSIFSFQGAAPRLFGETRRGFETLFAGMDRADAFRALTLHVSFRSAPAILSAVDAVFAAPAHHRGLASDGVVPPHEAWKARLPGLVELWPAIGPGEDETPGDWTPRAAAGAQAPEARLAERVADYVAELLRPGSPERVHDEARRPRPVRPGDVMILVRARGPIFESVNRALKARGLPAAGADRIRLAEHIAVMDLIAAARAALLRPDDLTLAAVLKSPLVGLDDDDLMALAIDREGALADALDAAPAPRHVAAARRLARWREAARRLSPFAFYARLLGEEGGRRAFVERLGPEAGDVCDEFLALALDHEQTAAVSLSRFVEAIESGELEIKRETETGGLIRVMTAHAAKGLEAKIVILPDTAKPALAPSQQPPLHRLARAAAPSGAPPFLIAAGKTADDPAAAAAARLAVQEAAEDEHRRLLYVALTRAEERLVIATAHGKRGPDKGSWRVIVETALTQEGALEEAPAFWDASESVLRRVVGASAPAPAPPEPSPPPVATPPWLFAPAPVEAGLAFLSPSAGAPVLAGEDGRRARRRGRRLHEIVEGLAVMAPDARARAAAALPQDERDLARQALRLIADPRLARLFGPGSRAEVALRATLPSGEVVVGRVDRVWIGPDEILVGDVKSGRAGDVARHAGQMRLYAAALAAIHPGRRVRTLLIFAGDGTVAEVE